MNGTEGQNWRKCKHTVKINGFGRFSYFEYSCYVIQTSKETVILRNQSKTCIYVRVQVDLKASWGSRGDPWGQSGGAVERLGELLARLRGVLKSKHGTIG